MVVAMEDLSKRRLPSSVLCIALASIANVDRGDEHLSAEEKEAASSANSTEERIDGAALFASIVLVFGHLSASVFAKSNRL